MKFKEKNENRINCLLWYFVVSEPSEIIFSIILLKIKNKENQFLRDES